MDLHAVLHHAQEDTQSSVACDPIAPHEFTQALGHRQQPLAHRQTGKYVIGKVGCRIASGRPVLLHDRDDAAVVIFPGPKIAWGIDGRCAAEIWVLEEPGVTANQGPARTEHQFFRNSIRVH